jgi:hypothetical protein
LATTPPDREQAACLEAGSHFGEGQLYGKEGEGDRENGVSNDEEAIEARATLGYERCCSIGHVLVPRIFLVDVFRATFARTLRETRIGISSEG